MTGRCAALLAVALITSPALGDHTHTLTVAGQARRYHVHLPARGDGAAPLPVVIALHGGGSNGTAMRRYSGLDEEADRRGFLAAFPDGSGRIPRVLTWNAGSCCAYARRRRIDDVAFLDAVIDDLVRRYRVDPRRVYLTGMSNGAMMAYRYATERPRRVAAVAAVAGTLEVSAAELRGPVPVMHFHGTLDEHVPFDGGRGSRTTPGNAFNSVPWTLEAWRRVNGALGEPETTDLPDVSDDGMHVVRKIYRASVTGADVVLFAIVGGGHSWPGRPRRAGVLGPTTTDLDANTAMWAFFRSFPPRRRQR